MSTSEAPKVAYDISVLGQGHINPKARTGIFRVVESLLLNLLQQKHSQITPLCLTGHRGIWGDMRSEMYFEEIINDASIHYLRSYSPYLPEIFFRLLIQTQRSLIQNVVPKAGFLYKPALSLELPFRKLGKISNEKTSLLSDIDVFHSPFHAFPDLDQVNGKPRVLTVYDLIPVLYRDKFTAKIYDEFIASIESIDLKKGFVLAISQSTKNDLCNHIDIDPERVFVTHLAASDEFYQVHDFDLISEVLDRYDIPEKPYFLSLCTLEPRKNLDFLVKCFFRLLADDSSLDINLVLVGTKGWKINSLFALISQYPQYLHRVILTGYVPDSDLSAIYSGATAFLYPSLYEGFGLPPLEAMQCGTPVVTSNTSSLPEVVGDAGLMVNPTDADAFCQAALNLLKDESMRAELSQRGLAQAKQFSWAKCADQTAEIYRVAAENWP